ncbi:transcriptional regulator CynR [Embleya hyalina]|uniref:Transcription regulator LysR family protein n=1 Tax=Embleya hyalina TaxID=516124 RepID=A0A401Z0G8_9ACTN|nr:transcriptional regulator CynR [Embleya hyalina]GCE00334.1 transcription regulator LysR family protein [Embleya hyalina]
MAPELRHLRYLLAVAEHGNFTRAAEELRVSQPTLSQQIKQLERILGVRLLDRSGRTVRPTDVGESYLHYARRALQDLAAAERAVHDVVDLTRGGLRLAVTPTFTTYLVGPLTEELYARHPGIALDVVETTQDRIESGLAADEFDLGIAFRGTHLPGLVGTALGTERLSLVVGATRSTPAPDAPPLPVRDLDAEHLALLSDDFATRGHIDEYFARHGVRPRIAVQANSIQALTEIVRRTPLATVLPDAIARDHPHLRPVAVDPPLPVRTVVLLRRESAYRSAAARAFERLTRDVVRARDDFPESAG